MKIKFLLAGLLLTGMAFAQGQFSGGGGSGNASITAPFFLTTPSPTSVNSGFGAGNATCASFDSNGQTDAGCAAVTNLFTFMATGGASFRHGWNYYFQTDTTQVNNPYGWAINGIIEVPAAGQVANDIWTTERFITVSGAGNTYTGNARVGKIRSTVASNTTLSGTLYGETFYLPQILSGATLTGGLVGWNCDTPAATGTFNGGYICFYGGTVVGTSLLGGTQNPAFAIKSTGTPALDAYCWASAVSASLVITSQDCLYTTAGTPNASLSANVGSVDLDTTNGVTWVKNSGTGNTGWNQQTQTIGSGTAAMTTAAITAGNCGTTVTVAASGVATTDTITWAFNAAPAGSNAGLVAWPTSGNVNFAYCPNSAETPAAATINWRVLR